MQVESLARSLAAHPFFAGMTPADLEFLAACTKNARFGAGQFVFREAAPATTLYFVREGRIALESHSSERGTVTLETVAAGDVLGWRALFERYAWHLDGRVLDPVLAFAVEGRCLSAKMEREPAFGFELSRRLLFHVNRRLERARLQQLDVYRAGR